MQSFNTPRGTIRVSTPEATAVDIVGYHPRVGGLDQAATILSELAERIDPQRLLDAARTAPITWVQRLGYLLALVDAREPAAVLNAYVKDEARRTVPLLPSTSREAAPRDADWKLFVNADVEPEL